jgi:hypothetical protein
MAKWLPRLTTNQEIPGSTPGTLASVSFLDESETVDLFKPCLNLSTNEKKIRTVLNAYILLYI